MHQLTDTEYNDYLRLRVFENTILEKIRVLNHQLIESRRNAKQFYFDEGEKALLDKILLLEGFYK